ncbi:MAG: YaaA family protein [Epsilonproteobacteria bacterium]|nr:YaaA family protein [Campylobacterota bacterium]
MTVLFAPSESKRPGGDLPPINREAFCLPPLFPRRLEALKAYDTFIKKADTAGLKKLFGLKKAEEIARYRAIDIFSAPTMKAVARYNGVAYTHLAYETLDKRAQTYVDDNLIIFSNLFGPVCAKDSLPDYKLKQGERLGDFVPERFYRAHFTDALTAYLKARGPVVDLRAGFYEKFYRIPLPHITMKFLKNNKAVSHWAKAYRGIVLKEMADNNIQNEADLKAMDIEGLAVKEIREGALKKEIVYEIVS